MKVFEKTRGTLARFALLNYPLALILMWVYMRALHAQAPGVVLFAAAAYFSYAALFVAAVWAVPRLLLSALRRADMPAAQAVVSAVALLFMSALCMLLLVDGQLFRLYGFHINGFVWNLLSAPGGLASMGISASAAYVVVAIAICIVAVQAALMFFAARRSARGVRARNTRLRYALAIAVALGVAERVAYGVANLNAYTPLMQAARVLPLYQATTFRGLATALGFKAVKDRSPKLATQSGPVQYPQAALQHTRPAKPLNIVWLTAESWRADMLDPRIMPRTFAFAESGQRFTRHYSGGNGTRMGMFSMFYGLYGNYWFSMLAQQRGPVLIDVLQQQGYDIEAYTSANFGYPEFDRTIFARVAPAHLHENQQGATWARDRSNVDALLSSLAERDRSKPFMRFMFFESPHARYEFPAETAIRRPYLQDFNYATMNLQRDIGLIKNRYINAVAHLDTQFARVLEYLQQQRLLDSTIVILTGDHGEEFMEKGRWGHNSTFVEEQVRVPFVLWVPGRAAARIDRMTSHLDVPATLLPLLGVRNKSGDYSLGTSMTDGAPRNFAVIASWSELAYRDAAYKAAFPFDGGSLLSSAVTDGADKVLSSNEDFYQARQKEIAELMRNSVRFNRPAHLAEGPSILESLTTR